MFTRVVIPVLVALVPELPESALLLLLLISLISVVSLLFVVVLSPTVANRVAHIVKALHCSYSCSERSRSCRCRRSH
jgi:hypothetical protein